MNKDEEIDKHNIIFRAHHTTERGGGGGEGERERDREERGAERRIHNLISHCGTVCIGEFYRSFEGIGNDGCQKGDNSIPRESVGDWRTGAWKEAVTERAYRAQAVKQNNLQASVYDVLPSHPAIIGYVTGP